MAIHPFMMTSWHRHSVHIAAFCEENRSSHGWIPLQMTSNVALLCFLRCRHEQGIERIAKLPVVWYVTARMWRHCYIDTLHWGLLKHRYVIVMVAYDPVVNGRRTISSNLDDSTMNLLWYGAYYENRFVTALHSIYTIINEAQITKIWPAEIARSTNCQSVMRMLRHLTPTKLIELLTKTNQSSSEGLSWCGYIIGHVFVHNVWCFFTNTAAVA